MDEEERCTCGKPASHVNADEGSADWACRVPAFDALTGKLRTNEAALEVLKAAAAEMRADWDMFTTADHVFYSAVADLLERTAARLDSNPTYSGGADALAIARAYLAHLDA